jgi:hypothetical protein
VFVKSSVLVRFLICLRLCPEAGSSSLVVGHHENRRELFSFKDDVQFNINDGCITVSIRLLPRKDFLFLDVNIGPMVVVVRRAPQAQRLFVIAFEANLRYSTVFHLPVMTIMIIVSLVTSICGAFAPPPSLCPCPSRSSSRYTFSS